MPRKKKVYGGKITKTMNPRALSNMMNRPSVPTPASTWERIKNFAKQHKVISRGLKAVSSMVGDKYSPIFNAGSSLADSYGYGRKKRGKGFSQKYLQKGNGFYKFGDPPNASYMYDLRKRMPKLMSGSGKVIRF